MQVSKVGILSADLSGFHIDVGLLDLCFGFDYLLCGLILNHQNVVFG